MSDDIEALKQQLESTTETTQGHIAELKEDIGNTTQQVRDATGRHTTELSSLSTEVQQVRDATGRHTTELSSLSEGVRQYESAIEELKGDIGNVAQQVIDATENHQTLLNRLSEAVRQVKDATDSHATKLEEFSREIERKQDDAIDDITDLTNKITDLQYLSESTVELLGPYLRAGYFIFNQQKGELNKKKETITKDPDMKRDTKEHEITKIDGILEELSGLSRLFLKTIKTYNLRNERDSPHPMPSITIQDNGTESVYSSDTEERQETETETENVSGGHDTVEH